MVKFSIQVTRDAHYEAANRTIGIAMKPAVGKQIFSDNLQDAAPGSFKGQFETERFVFGKIRDYTLRIASHGNPTQAILPVKASDPHVSTHDNIHDDLPFRVVADSLLMHSTTDGLHAPKSLMIHAVAHMLHDSNVLLASQQDINNQAHISQDLLKTRLGFKLLVAGRMGLKLDAQQSQRMMMSIGNICDQQITATYGPTAEKLQSFTPTAGRFSSMTPKTCILNDLIATLGAPYFKDDIDQHICCDRSPLSHVLNKTVSGLWLELKKEAGFGTAPIWYQQSMATGPPLSSISLENAAHHQPITEPSVGSLNVPNLQQHSKHFHKQNKEVSQRG